jgi:hypothetical protein
MAYLLIGNFQGGLDTRKSPFTAPPGSLRYARNVHLTRGAEIEVRKKFVPVYNLPPGKTKGCTSVRGQLYVFGAEAGVAVPAGVNYQQLGAPGGYALVRILSTDNFNGKIYVVGLFEDGSVYHFFDGIRVTDWDAIATSVASVQSLASLMASRVDSLEGISAVATNNQVVATAEVPGVAFTYSTNAVNGGAVNDQTLTATLSQANVAPIAAAYATCSFTITGGTDAQGVNQITQVAVGGVPLLAGPVDWVQSNNFTAAQVAARINEFTPTVRWVAAYTANKVTLTAQDAGAARNGLPLVVGLSGNVTTTQVSPTGGGVTPVAGTAQVVTFTFGGTFEGMDIYYITINGTQIALRGNAAGTGQFVRTLGQKVYATNASLMHFSGFTGTPAVPDPTQWGSDTTGAGFVNMSTQDGGSSELTGLAVYQNRMAVFSRRNVQIWTVDADEANNKQDQVLFNLGTKAPRTLAAFGDIDVFFLSESGVRSLRARDASNMASADDVGSPIDGELLAYMRSQDEAVVTQAVAISEPFEGRYLLAVGPLIYVFSHFPGAKVSAWTTYTLDEIGPNAVVTDWAVTSNSLVARVGDQLCLYGGLSGVQYDVTGAFPYEVRLPFLDADVPTAKKSIQGLDVGAEGYWDIYLALDPQQPDVTEILAKIKDSTYGEQGMCAAVGDSTHFSLTLKGKSNGYARLANLAIHFRSHENN